MTIVGYSLGTGVAAALVDQLRLKGRRSPRYDFADVPDLLSVGIVPRALVLVAAYTAVADVLTKYRPGGGVAVGKPLGWIPGLKGTI